TRRSEARKEHRRNSVCLRLEHPFCGAKMVIRSGGLESMPEQSWIITTAVGTGEKGYSGDGGPATRAVLNGPFDVGFDASGNLYFCETFTHCIRRVEARTGVITARVRWGGRGDRASEVIWALAGTGEPEHSGDGGPATAAGVYGARAVKVAADGTVYILERQGSTLRAVDPHSGIITTVAGTGERGYGGDDGPARAAVFNAPKELAIDREGNLLIVDTENHAIRRVDLRTR